MTKEITINFSRPDGHATFHGYRAHGVDPFFDMCRVLTDLEWPDGPAVFTDERAVRCLTVKSIHDCALRYRPTEAERIGLREYRSWFV